MDYRPDLIAEVLRQMHGGAVQDEVSKALAECVTEAGAEQKATTLTLKLTIKPESGGVFLVSHELSTKLPKVVASPSVMWGTPEGNLVTQNPRQRDLLEAAPIDDTPPEAVNVDETTG